MKPRKNSMKSARGHTLGTAFVRATWRSWVQSWKPFLSILIISMLGVAVLTGIYAGCRDTFIAADRFYDEQGLHDVQVISAAGLTRTDIEALQRVDGVSKVQAERMEPVHITVGNSQKTATLRQIGTDGIDQPYVQEGTLPTKLGEVAVTQSFIRDTGYTIGSEITVEPLTSVGNAQSQQIRHLKITGVVLDPQDVSNPDGYSHLSFRNNAASNYTLFVFSDDRDSADNAIYTAASIQVEHAQAEDTFSANYNNLVSDVTTRINTIAQPQWYVQTRSALSGFASLKSDISSIESLGKAFPVVFLIVAVMMSLTTMSRLVEEDRGFIGTYLALGYGRFTIAMRYVLFAILASLIGGGLGLLIGFLGIPAFLLVVIRGLYVLPDMRYEYDWWIGSFGVLLFVLGVLIATVAASIREMRQMPAVLMRPKAPKTGARIWLEHVKPLWKRMRFLNKVTARNIVRFKSRLLMTVGGVAGCTALIVCGLAINDSVAVLGKHQFEEINQYDMLVVANDRQAQSVRSQILSDGKTTAIMDAHIENAELTNSEGHGESVQLTVVPNNELATLNTMISLQLAQSDSPLRWISNIMHRNETPTAITLDDSGIIVSQSAAQSLGIHDGAEVTLRGNGNTPVHVRVSAVSRNLIGTEVYMSEGLYNKLLQTSQHESSTGSTDTLQNTALTWNAIYAKLKGDAHEQQSYVKTLQQDAAVMSAVSCAEQAENFKFELMGAVVALIVGLAGSLALVVMFTLAHTNVSERIREMATLKVLGFYDKEVHRYINREMLVMTLIGIVIGLPLGRWIAGLLTQALNMPSIYFEVSIAPWSYGIAALATLVFALLVRCFVNPVLDRIEPVISLKSVE